MSNSSAASPQATFLPMIAARSAATAANPTTTMEAEEREQQAEHCNEDDWVDTDGKEEEAGSLGHNEAVANEKGKITVPKPLRDRQRIKQLEAKVKSLEAQNSEQKHRLSSATKNNAKLAKAVGKLQKANDNLSKELSASKDKALEYKDKITTLEWELIWSSPLRVVGAAVRARYVERSKQDFINGTYVDVRGTANQDMIEMGNYFAHRACFEADISLFRLPILNTEASAFESPYGTSPTEHKIDGYASPKMARMWDSCGTLRCLEAHAPGVISEETKTEFAALKASCLDYFNEFADDKARDEIGKRIDEQEQSKSFKKYAHKFRSACLFDKEDDAEFDALLERMESIVESAEMTAKAQRLARRNIRDVTRQGAHNRDGEDKYGWQA
ncbi:hypothetical protein L207DRAFT_586665 [Hyaloscypha variabilis F]|uniref:Uncharacterized protein n=1 Tax=Hyaloscypha variabilis (strain UAMH 11265 / GT02V1 / F) TaxID=1149755 RepID=A0A2J6REN6_HYAVF|nr:hypothetical protein L207DRAFT_586665 [Hyaloscypha variabilis F]